MSKSILVVDDDSRIRTLLRDMLVLSGFEVCEAVDGLDALIKIRQDLPDAIILDVMMPNMDGITLCKKLRRDPDTSQLPIVMLSGKTHLGADKEGLAAGATKYLFKPIDMSVLINHLREVIKSHTVTTMPS